MAAFAEGSMGYRAKESQLKGIITLLQDEVQGNC